MIEAFTVSEEQRDHLIKSSLLLNSDTKVNNQQSQPKDDSIPVTLKNVLRNGPVRATDFEKRKKTPKRSRLANY